MEKLVIGLLILALGDGVYGLYEHISGSHHVLWSSKQEIKNAVSGTFLNRNHFSTFLTMTACLILGYLWYLVNPKTRKDNNIGHRRGFLRIEIYFKSFGIKGLMVSLSLLIMMVILLMSASRGGIISLLVAMIFMAGLIVSFQFRNSKAFPFLTILSLIISYSFFLAIDRVWDRFNSIELDYLTRLGMTIGAWNLRKDFFFGSGLGTFVDIFPKYQQDLSFSLYFTHNDWVQILAETGWVGLGFILFALFWVAADPAFSPAGLTSLTSTPAAPG